MRQNPERLAWTILLTAFVAFCLIAITCPLLVRSYMLNARRPLRAQVNQQRGTVVIERQGGNREAASQGNPPLELFKGNTVRAGQQDEALLTIQRGAEENRETLSSVVIYDNSVVILRDAYSPRFDLSSGSHKVILEVKGGRVRIEVQPAGDGRPVQVEVRTDHARTQLTEGSYALEVTNQQTTVTVRAGQADVHVGDQTLTLVDEQRAAVSPEGQIDGPLPTARDLIVNGDFGQGINTGWVRLPFDDPTARISLSDDDEQSVVQFQHTEAQPLEIELVQTLNRNVRDLESLVLHLKVYINHHSLSVCGSQGTECPVMVRLDYKSEDGGDRRWVHGFYVVDDPAINDEPSYCLPCPAPISGEHDRIQEKTWFLYESPNLMQIDPPELRPAIIQSVRIYASGHSYDSMVTDVELLAQE